MKVVIEHQASRDHTLVYVFNETPAGKFSAVTNANGMRWVEVEDGDFPPPLLDIPTDMWIAMAGELQSVSVATDATSAHLDDAKEVRDRLLVLVEGAWAGRLGPVQS